MCRGQAHTPWENGFCAVVMACTTVVVEMKRAVCWSVIHFDLIPPWAMECNPANGWRRLRGEGGHRCRRTSNKRGGGRMILVSAFAPDENGFWATQTWILLCPPGECVWLPGGGGGAIGVGAEGVVGVVHADTQRDRRVGDWREERPLCVPHADGERGLAVERDPLETRTRTCC